MSGRAELGCLKIGPCSPAIMRVQECKMATRYKHARLHSCIKRHVLLCYSLSSRLALHASPVPSPFLTLLHPASAAAATCVTSMAGRSSRAAPSTTRTQQTSYGGVCIRTAVPGPAANLLRRCVRMVATLGACGRPGPYTRRARRSRPGVAGSPPPRGWCWTLVLTAKRRVGHRQASCCLWAPHPFHASMPASWTYPRILVRTTRPAGPHLGASRSSPLPTASSCRRWGVATCLHVP